MEITETFHPATRQEWRAWLAQHHRDRSEIWLVSYRVAVGKPVVAYNDAVEEALCYGWIDSTRKSLDEERLAQRFTPRLPASPFSQTNLERLARLMERGGVIPAVLEQLGPVRAEHYRVPAEIEAALRASGEAWSHWQSFSPSYRRIRASYVESARDRGEAEYRKRLDQLVRKTAAGRQYGYGIEDFY